MIPDAARHKAVEAYLEDCRRFPNYTNGKPRMTWTELTPAERRSWINNPEPAFKEPDE